MSSAIAAQTENTDLLQQHVRITITRKWHHPRLTDTRIDDAGSSHIDFPDPGVEMSDHFRWTKAGAAQIYEHPSHGLLHPEPAGSNVIGGSVRIVPILTPVKKRPI